MIFGKKDKNGAADMSFLEHLEALRWHLVRSVIAVLILAVAAFIAREFVFGEVILGPKKPGFITYRVLCSLGQKFNLDICIREVPFTLINTSLAGQFMMHMWVSFITGIVVAFPYILWEVWRFIKPALHAKEKKYSTGVVFFSTLLFISGVWFGYYIITPMSVTFLGTYQVDPEIKNMIDLNSYISTLTLLTLATGIVFELPVVVYFLSKVGILGPAFMKKFRKHAFVVILILAAIITPTPDISGQVLVAIPLYILYELSIFVSASVEKKKKK